MDTSWIDIEQLPDDNGFAALAVGSHVETVELLTEKGFTPVSVESLVQQRLLLGEYHQCSWTGSRTTDLFLSRGGKYYLAHGDAESDLYSPDTAEFFQSFHEDATEIPLIDGVFTDVIEIPYHNFEIDVNQLDTHPVSRFLLGDNVEEYQEWLAGINIPFLPFMFPSYSLARHYPTDFMRPVIMRCTDNWSGIITANADLYTSYGHRGYTDIYDGVIKESEVLNPETLELFKTILNLEDSPYRLNDFVEHMNTHPYRDATGAILRVIRSGGNIPANYTTWLHEREQ